MAQRHQRAMPLRKQSRLLGLCACVGLLPTFGPQLGSGRHDGFPAWVKFSARRHVALSGLITFGSVMVDRPPPVCAEVTRLLDKTLHRHAKQLQWTADILVFDVHPMIFQGNWSGLNEMLKLDAFPNEAWHIVAYIVQGNEEFLSGAEDAPEKLDLAFREFSSLVGSDRAEGPNRKQSLKAWADVTATINSVMSAANNVIESEPNLQDISGFVSIPEDVGQYQRTPDQYLRRCTSIDGLFGGTVGAPCA